VRADVDAGCYVLYSNSAGFQHPRGALRRAGAAPRPLPGEQQQTAVSPHCVPYGRPFGHLLVILPCAWRTPWAVHQGTDGGTFIPCTQWADLARFDERGGGIDRGPGTNQHAPLNRPHTGA
jgi:hypothetical protein